MRPRAYLDTGDKIFFADPRTVVHSESRRSQRLLADLANGVADEDFLFS